MTKPETIIVTLSQDTMDAVRTALVRGDYSSIDEIVRDAMRDWSLKRRLERFSLSELRRIVQEGIGSSPGLEANPVFARLTAKYTAMEARQTASPAPIDEADEQARDEFIQDKWVTVMADYESTPIWDRAGACVPTDWLPVASELLNDLDCWVEEYSEHLPDDPNNKFDGRAHAERGFELTCKVKQQLQDWTVVYSDCRIGSNIEITLLTSVNLFDMIRRMGRRR